MSVNGLTLPYRVIAERIIGLLENGHIPWRKPWLDVGPPKSLASGRPYRGVNLFLLACMAATEGYASPYWLTFRQCRERGGYVKNGEKGTPVVFWKLWKPATDAGDGDPVPEDGSPEGGKVIPVLRYYTVFNVRQCEGIDAPEPKSAVLDFDPIIRCETVVGHMPRRPAIRHGDPRAYYSPTLDLVNVPEPKLFTSASAYYATLFHELVHATGHPDRLNRPGVTESAGFGTEPYAKEEFVAEIGSAFLCGHCGIEQDVLENAAAYIDGWLVRIRKDPKLVVIAGAQAQRAADYILETSGHPEATSETGEAAPTAEEVVA